MLQVMDSIKYSAHCSLFHFRAKKNPAQKLLLLSQQYKGMIKLFDFIVEYQLVACNSNVTTKVLIFLQFERSREQKWSSCDRALSSHQCGLSSIPRVDAMSRPFGRGGGATCELAPPPPTAAEVYFLKYINKVVSAKGICISFEFQKFCEMSTVRFWLHVFMSYHLQNTLNAFSDNQISPLACFGLST